MTEASVPKTTPQWGFARNKTKFRYKVFGSTITSTPEGTWLERAPSFKKSQELAHSLRLILEKQGMAKLNRVATSDAEHPLVHMKRELSEPFEAAVDKWWTSIARSDLVECIHDTQPVKIDGDPEHLFKQDITPRSINSNTRAVKGDTTLPSFSVEVHGLRKHVYELRAPLFTWVQADHLVRIGTDQRLTSPTGGTLTSFEPFKPGDIDNAAGRGASLSRCLTQLVHKTMGGVDTSSTSCRSLPDNVRNVLSRKVIELHQNNSMDMTKGDPSPLLDIDSESPAYRYKSQMLYFGKTDGKGTSVYSQHAYSPVDHPTPPMLHLSGPCRWQPSGSYLRIAFSGCLRSTRPRGASTDLVQLPTQTLLKSVGDQSIDELNLLLKAVSGVDSKQWLSEADAASIHEAFIGGLASHLYFRSQPGELFEVEGDCTGLVVTTACSIPLGITGKPRVEVHWTFQRPNILDDGAAK